MGLIGDFDRMARLSGLLHELPQAVERAPATMAEELNPLLKAEFDAGTDPYGTPWRPLAPATLARGRSAPPLTATGKMRASAVARATKAGVAVSIALPAPFLEAARPMVPELGTFPDAWREAVKESLERELDAARAKL